jgi:PIN domain nuclease of toxin-antitoxin system
VKLLLDTHAFIWWDNDKSQLSQPALDACLDQSNTLFLSIASIWEMQIKIQTGKLSFTIPLEQRIIEQTRINGLKILPIRQKHIYTLAVLPDHHRDPFDRLLIAQSIYEKMTLISHDAQIKQYSLQLLW